MNWKMKKRRRIAITDDEEGMVLLNPITVIEGFNDMEIYVSTNQANEEVQKKKNSFGDSFGTCEFTNQDKYEKYIQDRLEHVNQKRQEKDMDDWSIPPMFE